MEILTPTHSDQLPKALNDPSGNLLRPAQMAEHYNDLQVAKSDLENPRVQDKGAVRQRVSNLQRQYDSQAPRPITDGATKDALAKESKQLLNDILPGMLSQEEMRKNPAGSVDKHLRWERTNKKKIIRLKKILTVLNADDSDPHTWDRDAANLERFRPVGPQDRLRTDAQISGHMSFGSVPDDNWKQAFGTTEAPNSALKQAQRVEKDPLRAVITEAQQTTDLDLDVDIGTEYLPPIATPIRKPGRPPMSAEQRKLMGERLAQGRLKKKLNLQTKGV